MRVVIYAAQVYAVFDVDEGESVGDAFLGRLIDAEIAMHEGGVTGQRNIRMLAKY